MTGFPALSALVFAPAVGSVILCGLARGRTGAIRAVGLIASLSTLAICAAILPGFHVGQAGYQWVERRDWIAALNVHYYLGLDGMSLLLVLLTGLVAPAGLLASWGAGKDERAFGALFLALQTCALGVFLALDFFHWFLFWELSLAPAFFLIKQWGGPRSAAAAFRFVIYTVGGSVFLLLGFAAIFAMTGSLDFVELGRMGASGELASRLAVGGGGWPKAIFLGVFLGLAVKVPLFPFHGWLPAAYAEAPTGVSMFLTGVMSKMGVYGFLRILWPLFPAQLQAVALPLLWLALGGVVLGALAAVREPDLKRMVAYSSLNHVSYCLLALFAVAQASAGVRTEGAVAAALSGALLQMFNHGLSASALFLCVGVLEARAGGRRGRGDFGGVLAAAPIFAGLSGVALFSSLGLPGLNGFVGEFLIFRGVFGLAPWAATVGCIGLLVTAIFLLGFWQRVFHGPRAGAAAGEFREVSGPMIGVLASFAGLMVLFGILPGLLTRLYNPLVASWVEGILSR